MPNDRNTSSKATLHRCLEMMALLSQNNGKTINELADFYDCSSRTIQRTLKTIEEAGYVIEKSRGRYKINKEETQAQNGFDLGKLLHFTAEEAWILDDAINSIEKDTVVKENLVKKLYAIYDSELIVSHLTKKQERIIADAIKNKMQVKIVNYYQSSVGEKIFKMIGEPIKFEYNYSRVWMYFPRFKKTILMRISGLDGLKETNEVWKCEHRHKVGEIDVFRGYGNEMLPITLLLDVTSYGYLIDEYPLAKKDVQKFGDVHYLLKTKVSNYKQVVRFICGLPGHVNIIDTPDLEMFLEIYKKESEEKKYPQCKYDRLIFKDGKFW